MQTASEQAAARATQRSQRQERRRARRSGQATPAEAEEHAHTADDPLAGPRPEASESVEMEIDDSANDAAQP